MHDGTLVGDHEHIHRSRLRVDTPKWVLAKALPKIYGDKIQTEISGGLDVTAQRAETEALVEALKRLDITELRMMIGFYRKAGLALPGE